MEKSENNESFLAPIFIQEASQNLRESLRGDAGLETLLEQQYMIARSAWPQIEIPREMFVSYLAQRLPADRPWSSVRHRLRSKELYLTCACARCDDVAIRTFEDLYFDRVQAALARMEKASDFIDEIKQILRQVLFVPKGSTRARICEYYGHGDLGRWLKMVAFREVVRIRQHTKEETGDLDAWKETLVDPSQDLELDYLKKHYRSKFQKSVRRAIEQLSVRERHLLQMHFGEKLNIDEIARLQKVHRSTAARWLVKIRGRLMTLVKNAFLADLQVSSGQANSILQLIESQLDISLQRWLVTRNEK